MTITWNFWSFQYFDFETNFLKKRKLFLNNWSTVFWLKALRWTMQHFHIKLLYQKSVLRQTEWGVQNGPGTKNGVFCSNCFVVVFKFCFSLRTSYKELIWCANYLNVHIHTFQKRWRFILGCFYHVSVLKSQTKNQNWFFL